MRTDTRFRVSLGGLAFCVFTCLIATLRAQPALPMPMPMPAPAPAPASGAEPPATPQPVPQRSLAQKIRAWEALPIAQRRERRVRYQAWRDLDPGERAQLRVVAAEFASFDARRQAALRAQFAALDDRQRHGWRLGIGLGAAYPSLHPLLGYVPETQRLPLLAMLGAMTTDQLADLSLLAQRTPPAERQAVRATLLALPPSRRGIWLRQRLAE